MRWALIKFALAWSALFLSAAAFAQVPTPTGWALRLPAQETVAFRGGVSMDGAGQGVGGQMLYPAPSAVGFLAAVITHGILVESAKNGQRRALQEEADKVLAPFGAVLGAFTNAQLMGAAIVLSTVPAPKRILGAGENVGNDLLVVSMPVYTLTQDHRALVLENAVAIHRPGDAAKPMYERTIRVVSAPRQETEPSAYWSAAQGLALKQESARLLAHSLDLAVQDAAASDARAEAAAFRTIRYREGSTERMERAQPLSHPCERIIIRTLRGGLMSLPASGGPQPGCVAALPDWR